MRPATPDELERWDELIAANPDGGSALQLKAFGQVKANAGWETRRYVLGSIAIQVLVRHIKTLGEFWYLPNGPGVIDRPGLAAFVEAARILSPAPFVIKIDPEIPKDDLTGTQLLKLGFVPAARNLQYNVSTVVVALEPNEDDILSSFKQKTRYNVRLAVKKGVVVAAVPTNKDSIDQMYDLYTTTTQRAGVYLRSKQYFIDYWKLHADSGHGQMFFATYEGQVLAGAFITFVGTKALYKDGGSVREHTEAQAPYALQWGIMQWLKAQGMLSYDLHGVPPKNQIDNPNHPLAGLARFKLGFQPEVTEFIGTYDLPLKSAAYQQWRRIGERVAVAYEYRVKKRLFY